jgi:hypothetical protein
MKPATDIVGLNNLGIIIATSLRVWIWLRDSIHKSPRAAMGFGKQGATEFMAGLIAAISASFRGPSIARQPGIHTPQSVFMDSGLASAALRRPGMTASRFVRSLS